MSLPEKNWLDGKWKRVPKQPWKPGPMNSKVTIRGTVEHQGGVEYWIVDDTGHIVNDDNVSLNLNDILWAFRGKRIRVDVQEIQPKTRAENFKNELRQDTRKMFRALGWDE